MGLTGLAVTGARALLEAVITSTLAFMVFTFGSLLVAIQVASGQMTPRIIATVLLRNNVVRYTVGLFIFTFLVALGTQDRIDGKSIACRSSRYLVWGSLVLRHFYI